MAGSAETISAKCASAHLRNPIQLFPRFARITQERIHVSRSEAPRVNADDNISGLDRCGGLVCDGVDDAGFVGPLPSRTECCLPVAITK